MKLFYFLLLITPCIIFHELSHLAVALFFNLPVEKFSFGFGPEVIGLDLFNIHWQLSLFPLGGYVEFPGESQAFMQPSGQELEWFLVAIAGPLSNFLMTIGIFKAYFFILYNQAEIKKVKYNNEEGVLIKFNLSSFWQNFYAKNLNSLVFFLGENNKHQVVNRSEEDKIEVLNVTKISLGSTIKFSLRAVREMIFYPSGLHKTVARYSSKNIIEESLTKDSGVIGPFSLGGIGLRAKNQSWALFILLMASINLSLGVFNLIPLAVLDGGKALSVALIKFSGSNISGSINDVYVLISFALVLGLTLYAILKDLFKRNSK